MIVNWNRVKGIIAMTAALAVIIVINAGAIYGAPPPLPPLTPEQKFLKGETKDCPGCNLSELDLNWAKFPGANLTGANLSGANLTYANLSGANLSGANLSRTNLKMTNLSGANLSGANLSGADLNGAIWTDGSRCWSRVLGQCH